MRKTNFVAILSLCVAVIFLVTLIQDVDISKTQSSYKLIQKPELIQWKVYGKQNLPVTQTQTTNNFTNKNQPLLKSVPTAFQESLLSAIPLDCHPETEGVFKEWHSKFLNILIEYGSNHSRMKKTSSPRTLIWHCKNTCGGIADRIRGITYSLLLAIFSHRNLILFLDNVHESKYLYPNMIDWRDTVAYQHLRGDTAGKIFENPFRFTVRAVPSGVKIWNGFRKNMTKNLEVIKGSNKTNVLIATNLKPSTLANSNITGNVEWIAAGIESSGLSNLSYDEFDTVIGLAFRYLFKLDGEVSKNMQFARYSLNLLGPYSALHVRTGFMGTLHKEHTHSLKFQQNTSQWLSGFNCAVSAADKSLGKSSLIYLASDSNMVKDLAIKYFPERFVMLNNTILHVNLLTNPKSNLDLAQSEKGLLVVWIELFLLAQANTLVRGDSGFSWIAGLLCGQKTIITNAYVCTAN